MSELISAVVSQHLQQVQQNQPVKQDPAQKTGGKSFESHLQDQMKTDGDKGKTNAPKDVPATDELERIQAELQKKISSPDTDPAKTNQLLKDILGESGGRMSMLKDAYNNLSRTSKVPSDLRGNLVNAEGEWNAVQGIMNSNKNLTQGELLALQQRLYMVSQHVEVMSKVVDQMAGGIKTVLNTNI